MHAWCTKGREEHVSWSLLEGKRPAETIVVRFSSGDEAILLADDIDELQPLMKVRHDCAVLRDPASLSAAMKEMLRFGHDQIGSRSLTIHCSRAFPSVILKTCKASPMPHIQQDRNIWLHS